MLQEESNRLSLQDSSVSAPIMRTVNVLILEQNDDETKLLVKELQSPGVHIRWQQITSEEAFLQLLKAPCDLILTGNMPGRYLVQDVIHLLQARGLSIPVLAVSHAGADQDAVALHQLGVCQTVPRSRLGELGKRAVHALQGLRKIAYFSMEIALEPSIPTYSGGLGILAGDTLRSAADLQVPMVAVTLVHHAGYFQQHLDSHGWQQESPMHWEAGKQLIELPYEVFISLEGRRVQLRVWKYEIHGVSGYTIPVYLLDTKLPQNQPCDRDLTDVLYGGDWKYRLNQEMILGVGGIQALRTLGYDQLERFHMNEGHASLLTLALLTEHAQKAGHAKIEISDLAAIRQRCVFTTHTPVPAGHDQFPIQALSQALWGRDDAHEAFSGDVAERVLGRRQPESGEHAHDGLTPVVNMSYLALNMSRYINGVAKRHGEISRLMFSGYAIDAITNGVHAATWIAQSMQDLLDRYIPDWRHDNFSLRNAESIPRDEIWEAHAQAKSDLLKLIRYRTGKSFDPQAFTIGLARRATAYKRLDLLFSDPERLRQIGREAGTIQVICSGKAHPADIEGKRLIQRIHDMQEQLMGDVEIAFIENYDMEIASKLVSGVDVWLNTPQPPLEASGTSGMKAAMNGVPSFSILDGWWIEGWIEGVTGWSIESSQIASGSLEMATEDRAFSATSLYNKLQRQILPLYYADRPHYAGMMQHTIALNGSYFNTQRMLQQYVVRAYLR